MLAVCIFFVVSNDFWLLNGGSVGVLVPVVHSVNLFAEPVAEVKRPNVHSFGRFVLSVFIWMVVL